MLYAWVDTCAVIVAAYGLEALAETDEERVDEHADTSHDRHARNGGVAIPSGSYVEQDGGKACQSLPAERGASSVKDFAEISWLWREVAQADADVFSPAVHVEQDAEAAHLSAQRGVCRSGDAHAAYEDEQRSQPDVEHRAGGDAHHGVGGVALKAHLVVQHQRRCHEGRSQQDDAQISLGIGQDSGGRAQYAADRGQEQEPEKRDEASHDEGAEESRCRHFLGTLIVARPQPARDEIARPVSEEESERLYDSHDREGNSYGGGGLGVDFPYEIGIYHHVE